jgi:hypothetical protein
MVHYVVEKYCPHLSERRWLDLRTLGWATLAFAQSHKSALQGLLGTAEVVPPISRPRIT